MRNRNLIIISLVALTLGAFIFFFERHQPTTDERQERADRLYPGIEEEAVVAVELETSHGPIRLAKTDDVWRLVEPLDYPADPTVVRSLIQSVAGLDAERVLPLGEVELADYGLEAPVLGVVLSDTDGRQFALAVGDTTPLGSKRAVRRGTDEEIVITSDTLVATLDKDVDQWRSRDVIDVLEHDLASVEIETAEDLIRARRLRGKWFLEEPLADLADEEQMRALVSELNTLRVSEFLAADGDPTAHGLGEPEYRIRLIGVDDEQPMTLELAAPVEGEGAATVVCRRNGVDLFLIPETIRSRLAKAPVLWRSAKVWSFSSWDVSGFEIESVTGDIDLVQEDGLWEIRGGGEADNAEVRRRLTALADLEARDHDLVLPPTEVVGSAILELDDDETASALTYTFYAPIEEGGHAAVTVSGRDTVMGVDAVSVEAIVGDLEKLRPAPEAVTPEE